MSDPAPTDFDEHVQTFQQLIEDHVRDRAAQDEIFYLVETMVKNLGIGQRWCGCQVAWPTVPNNIRSLFDDE